MNERSIIFSAPMVLPVPSVELIEADELSTTERGAGGFGSTGDEG